MTARQATAPKPLARLPVPWRITFDTNPDDCNLHCLMCEEHSLHSPRYRARIKGGLAHRRMETETLRCVVAECAPYGLREVIPSTMGEPLLYRHFPWIVEICRQHGVKLNLTTNGTFPGRGAKGWAELIVAVTSDAKISWNGATPRVQEQVMVGSRLARQLENLRDFITVRDAHTAEGGNYCSVTLQMTFMEVNLREIPKVVELALNLGVDRVKGHHLWVHSDEMKEQNLRRNPDSIRRWNEVVRQCHALATANPRPSGKRLGLENFYELDPVHGVELHPTATCPFLGREAWINYAGRFDPCCAPDELRARLGSFGNVVEWGLLSIWNGEAYQELMERYLEHDICRGCNMRKPPGETS